MDNILRESISDVWEHEWRVAYYQENETILTKLLIRHQKALGTDAYEESTVNRIGIIEFLVAKLSGE